MGSVGDLMRKNTMADKKTLDKIREDIGKSTIPDMLKVLYLMANATELLSQQSFLRIKAVFARYGLVVKENELLSGINKYCKLIRQATFQFFERIDPQITDATWGLGRDENEPNAPGNSSALDGFNEDANEICRLVLLYIDRTARNNDAFAKVFKTLRQLPSSGIINDEDIARFKMK